MEYRSRLEGGITVVSCAGRMDAASSPQFKEYLKRVIDEGNCRLVIAMDRVEFLDSSGLGALVTCLRKAREKNGDLKISGLSPEVRSIFEMTGLTRVFDIHGQISTALEAFGKGRG
jgi:anti-sigma B factor antagonist